MRWFLQDAATAAGIAAVLIWLTEPGWLGGTLIVVLCAWAGWRHWLDERPFREPFPVWEDEGSGP